MHRQGSQSAEQNSYCMAAVKCRTTHAWSSEDLPPGCGCTDDLLYPTHNNFWINQKKSPSWNSLCTFLSLPPSHPHPFPEHREEIKNLCKIFLNIPSFVLFNLFPQGLLSLNDKEWWNGAEWTSACGTNWICDLVTTSARTSCPLTWR